MATKEKDQFYIELCEKAGVIKRKLKPTTKHLGQAILINFINAIFYDEQNRYLTFRNYGGYQIGIAEATNI